MGVLFHVKRIETALERGMDYWGNACVVLTRSRHWPARALGQVMSLIAITLTLAVLLLWLLIGKKPPFPDENQDLGQG